MSATMTRQADVRTALLLFAVVIGMVGMSFAAVPLYDLFCRVTGYGGTTQVASNGTIGDHGIVDRDMRIRFAASTHRDMPWQFRPVQGTETLKIGEEGIAYFEAYNPTNQAITGTASYNVTPFKAGSYFVKIQCFCFTEQTLGPGERVNMPVIYYIDPAILEDDNAGDVTEITLAYTFFVKED